MKTAKIQILLNVLLFPLPIVAWQTALWDGFPMPRIALLMVSVTVLIFITSLANVIVEAKQGNNLPILICSLCISLASVLSWSYFLVIIAA